MLNQPVPYFELPSTGNKTFRLSAAPGKTLLIYFYPKDNTPGCTTEGQQFSDAYASHTKLATTPFVLSALRSKVYRSMNGVATAVFRFNQVRQASGSCLH